LTDPELEALLPLLVRAHERSFGPEAVVARRVGTRHARLMISLPESPGRFGVFYFARSSAGWVARHAAFRNESEARALLDEQLDGEPQAPRRARAEPTTEREGARGDVVVVRAGKPVDAARIDAAERALGTRLPAGARTFLGTHGAVALADGLTLFSPERMVEELDAWREVLATTWSWECDELPLAHALESVCVASHDDGSSLLFHPAEPDRLFALGRDEEEARDLGLGFVPALLAYERSSPLLLVGVDAPLVRVQLEGDVPARAVVATLRSLIRLDRDVPHDDGWDGLSSELRGTIVVDGDEEGCQVELEVAPSFVLSSARRALARVTKRLHALGLRSVT